jgi:hypothetical protein
VQSLHIVYFVLYSVHRIVVFNLVFNFLNSFLKCKLLESIVTCMKRVLEGLHLMHDLSSFVYNGSLLPYG